jgi:hypothetical protein
MEPNLRSQVFKAVLMITKQRSQPLLLTKSTETSAQIAIGFGAVTELATVQ